MFDFFKRKSPPPPPPELAPPDAAPAGVAPPRVDEAVAVEEPASRASSAEALAAPLAPAPEAATASDEAPAEPERRSWKDRLKASLGLSRERLARPLAGLFTRQKLTEEMLEEFEAALLLADVGMPATQHLLDDMRVRWKRAGSDADGKTVLKDSLVALLAPLEQPLTIGPQRPFVIMLAGVNGAGKTTSIGKLARYFQAQGHSVLLAAGDTFRAAAREQLEVWGQRNNVQVIAQSGGDPAAVMYDAIVAARARGVDIVLADTAGRLPTQAPLMEELRKIRRVIAKADPSAPHEVLLVLDANIGQNALAQLSGFDAVLGLTGLVLTKLDGTAKGGVVAAIAKNRPVPLRFIGVGEGVDDLRPFRAQEFVDALLD